ncbi:hypothetical protein E3N88_40796 [Mikania micrantha]|uniref:Germin-like protein n=1 Tax=Mikania micrantha TaxID=192012 RepID=A0A5N6LNQ6_9ASTR|nr:hypothetical protein E3N88_40796 [Mikania micrantha]
MARVLGTSVVLMLVFTTVWATDHSPLQDFCVADLNNQEKIICVDSFDLNELSSRVGEVKWYAHNGEHFKCYGIKCDPSICVPNTRAKYARISLARLDFAPWGVIPPHTHPRATEILTVLEGQIQVGFVTSNPENHHFSKVLNKGDVFVFPVNLVHYQHNVGNTYAVAMVALSSQNPGVIPVGNAIFGSKPDISTDILAKAFQVREDVISNIQTKF